MMRQVLGRATLQYLIYGELQLIGVVPMLFLVPLAVRAERRGIARLDRRMPRPVVERLLIELHLKARGLFLRSVVRVLMQSCQQFLSIRLLPPSILLPPRQTSMGP